MSGRRGDGEGMAWPRDDDEPIAPPAPQVEVPPSTREMERKVKQALADRQPHVAPLREIDESEADPILEEEEKAVRRSRQREADPIFVLMVIGAVSIGLSPVDANTRYLILWTFLGAAGLVSYTLGMSQRLNLVNINDLISGVVFGLATGISFLIPLGNALNTISDRMFSVDSTPDKIMDSWVFMAVVFVQPAAETLFFRGAMQQFRNMAITAALATLWTSLLFFPHMELANALSVALTLGVFFIFLNFLYSYVRFRNGLAAAWICQMIAGGFLWFIPRLLF